MKCFIVKDYDSLKFVFDWDTLILTREQAKELAARLIWELTALDFRFIDIVHQGLYFGQWDKKEINKYLNSPNGGIKENYLLHFFLFIISGEIGYLKRCFVDLYDLPKFESRFKLLTARKKYISLESVVALADSVKDGNFCYVRSSGM